MKTVKVLFKVILSLLIGTMVIMFFATRKELVESLSLIFSDIYKGPYLTEPITITTIAIIVLVSAIIGSVLVCVIRFFSNNKSNSIVVSLANALLDIFVAFPVATLLMYILDIQVFALTNGWDSMVYLACDIAIFTIVFSILCYFLNKEVKKNLDKPQKRYALIICEVKDEHTIEETKIIIKKKLFQQCYNAMLANQNQLASKQFFSIREYNWSGKRILNSWSYYKNRELIEVKDEELCKKLLVAEYAKEVKWQG